MLKKIGNILGLLLVVGMLVPLVLAAPASAAPGPPSGNGIQPVEVPSNPVCPAGTIELKVEPVEDGTYSDGTLTVTVTVNEAAQTFDFTSNIGVDAVIAKGGPNGNVYTYNPEATADTGLHAPLNEDGSGQFYGLSHISFCYDVSPPDLGIEKSSDAVDGTVEEGGSFTYTITVENTGDLPAHNVLVTDDLNDDLTVDAVTPSQGTCDPVGAGNTISCNLGTLNGLIAGPPTTATVEIDVTAPVLDASANECSLVLRNTATVASDETASETSNEVVVTVEGDAELTINKTTSVPVDVDTDFVFNVTGPGGFDENLTVTILANQSSGSATLGGLEDGDYLVTELETPPFAVFPPFTVPVDRSESCTVEADVENTFGPATATVQKVTDPEDNEEGWTFNLYLDDDGISGPSDPNTDTLYSTVTTTDASAISFPDALADEGDYYVLEEEQTGWDSDGGDAGCSFTVNYPASADTVFACVFTNIARGTISVEKLLDGATSTDTFDFELRTDVDINDPLNPADDDAGDVVAGSFTTITANGVAVQLDGDLPLGTYALCEFVMPGFTSTFDGNQGYTLVIDEDNVRLCYDVTITFENQDVTVAVDNISPPGGEQRTIGFWKNWTSCDGHGNQEAILDQTLAAAGGSILVGDLLVNNCPDAVDILNKSTLAGVKKASDPAFNLAAQYLAARLNQEADAEVCPAAQDAMDDAQALLDAFGFNGTKVMTKAEIKSLGTSFNNVAATLDSYNNGLLC
jgi:uncharacterized repeat protein (TIGR01451 family)